MDMISVVNKLDSLGLIRANKIVGNYYQCYCPIHSNGQEKHPSSGILITQEYRNGQIYPEGWFHCFSCGLAVTLPELLSLIFEAKGIHTKSSIDWLKENIPGFEYDDSEFDSLLPRGTVQNLNNNFALNYLKSKLSNKPAYIDESELSKYRYTVPYLYERKLTDEIITKFDVGVDLNYVPADKVKPVPCITFPVRDISGNVIFIYRRAIKTKNFYMPAGIEKPVYGIYELPKAQKSVIICESIFNALTCYVYGYPAVALFGTGTKSQINQLKLLGVKEFILGLDPDEAGNRGSNKLKNALKSVGIVRKMELPQGKDINDLERDEFIEILGERV